MIERNKIIHGDSLEYMRSLPDKCIDLVLTDPPYEIQNVNAGGDSDFSKSFQKMNNQIKEAWIVDGIWNDFLVEIFRICKKPNIYIWCNHKQIPQYLDFFYKKKWCKFDILIWRKDNAPPTFNNKYLTDKEYCLYFRKWWYCNPKTYQDAGTVFDYPINIKDKQMFKHPTIKPKHIISTLIRNSSKPWDLVLDCFAWSWTTAVACIETGRDYIVIEKEKDYVDIIERRVKSITSPLFYL